MEPTPIYRGCARIDEVATQPDRCPNIYSQYSYSEYQGCLTKLLIVDIEPDDTASGEESGLDILTIFALIAIGVVFILIGAVVTLLKKKPKGKKRKRRSDGAVKTFADEPELEIPGAEEVLETEIVSFAATWEELPPGKWLDTDEKGTSWYLDDDGRHWFSADDGFHVWQQ